MADTTEITWQQGMAFDVSVEGSSFGIDASEAFGGRGHGPKPKTLLLSALAGCTGMDVVSILAKMRMPFDGLRIQVDGELTDEHPKVYRSIHVTYRFSGTELDRAKIDKAVSLSQERYCGVTAMLSKTAKIEWDIVVEGTNESAA